MSVIHFVKNSGIFGSEANGTVISWKFISKQDRFIEVEKNRSSWHLEISEIETEILVSLIASEVSGASGLGLGINKTWPFYREEPGTGKCGQIPEKRRSCTQSLQAFCMFLTGATPGTNRWPKNLRTLGTRLVKAVKARKRKKNGGKLSSKKGDWFIPRFLIILGALEFCQKWLSSKTSLWTMTSGCKDEQN